MDDVTTLRDELVLQYNATAEPSEYGAQEFNADLDALIAKVEAETRAGLVEALKGRVKAWKWQSEDRYLVGQAPGVYEQCAQEVEETLAALPAPEPSSGAAPVEERCGAWDGCLLPRGHNRGRADVPENHFSPAYPPLPYPAPRSAGAGDGRADR